MKLANWIIVLWSIKWMFITVTIEIPVCWQGSDAFQPNGNMMNPVLRFAIDTLKKTNADPIFLAFPGTIPDSTNNYNLLIIILKFLVDRLRSLSTPSILYRLATQGDVYSYLWLLPSLFVISAWSSILIRASCTNSIISNWTSRRMDRYCK